MTGTTSPPITFGETSSEMGDDRAVFPSAGLPHLTPHREPTRSVQFSGPGVKGVEGLKGFSASASPPSLDSLHFSPREAVEKNYPHCSPLPEIPLGALDPEVEGFAFHDR